MLRRICSAVGVAAVLLLLAACSGDDPGRGDAHPQRLPVGIPSAVIAGCEESAGLGASAAATILWRDSQGVHARIGAGRPHSSGGGGGLSNTQSALISCLTLASGVREAYPTDSAGLLLLWKYSTTVLWPCLQQHGVEVGRVPTRSAFLTGDPLRIDPYNLIRSKVSDEMWTRLRQDCPAVPPYLKAVGG